MRSSDTLNARADYLPRNTCYVQALPIVSILLSSMRLSFANRHNYFFQSNGDWFENVILIVFGLSLAKSTLEVNSNNNAIFF